MNGICVLQWSQISVSYYDYYFGYHSRKSVSAPYSGIFACPIIECCDGLESLSDSQSNGKSEKYNSRHYTHGGDSSSLENNGAMSKMKHMTCPPRHLVLCPSEMPIAGGHPGPLQGCRGVLRGQGRVENRIAPCGNSCPRGGKGCRPGASPGPRRAPGPAAPTTPRGSAGSFWL